MDQEQGAQYLALWHLERMSFTQAKKYFLHLLSPSNRDVQLWFSLCVCHAMAGEVEECQECLTQITQLNSSLDNDLRYQFCLGLLLEKKLDFKAAIDQYTRTIQLQESIEKDRGNVLEGEGQNSSNNNNSNNKDNHFQSLEEIKRKSIVDVKGDCFLRIAWIHKEINEFDQVISYCDHILLQQFTLVIKANAQCLKGIVYEIRCEYPSAEIEYRVALQLLPSFPLPLERLGRLYLRYRETIPAAVQCFVKYLEIDPSGHVAWYMLGRCYMTTGQYVDAWEAYYRAVNLNPNDPQVWSSLGVLYYSFGQYQEALGMFCRAIKLDPKMSDAWYNVGVLYDMIDQTEDAQRAYYKAKETGLQERFAKSGLVFSHDDIV